MREWRQLRAWLVRSRPPTGDLARALIAGVSANVTGLVLLAGAVGLLVTSAQRPGLRAVAGVLVVIEVVAFTRSPLRYGERMAAHRLGFDAVTNWRRWLVRTVGIWPHSKWVNYSSGDLLERALRDTDELQDLWLRAIVPVSCGLISVVIGEMVILVFPGHGGWFGPVAASLAVVVLAVGVLGALLPVLLRHEREVRFWRTSRAGLRESLVGVGFELRLLGRTAYVEQLVREAGEIVVRFERRLLRRQRAASSVAYLASVAIVVVVVLLRPTSAPVWLLVAIMIGVGVGDVLLGVRTALDVVVGVNAASERLDELSSDQPAGRLAWPGRHDLDVVALSWSPGETALLRDVTLRVAAGSRVALTGVSGVGKSSLLRLLARLDNPPASSVFVGGVDLVEIDENELRAHVAYVGPDTSLWDGVLHDALLQGRRTDHDLSKDLALVGLSPTLNEPWPQPSRGEKERAAIVRALLGDPDVLLLDEPTSGLDGASTERVLSLLANDTRTIVVATHDPQVVAWCDEHYELREGRLQPLTR